MASALVRRLWHSAVVGKILSWVFRVLAVLWVVGAVVVVLVHASGRADAADCAPPDPGARPVIVLAAGELQALARVLWAENRGNGYCGMLSIGAVIVNRIQQNPKVFGATITQVTTKPYQFSVFGKADPNFLKMQKVDESDASFFVALLAAMAAVGGQSNIADADHFYSGSVVPDWARRMTVRARIYGHTYLYSGR